MKKIAFALLCVLILIESSICVLSWQNDFRSPTQKIQFTTLNQGTILSN